MATKVKAITDELMSLLSPTEQTALREKLAANPDLLQRVKTETDLYNIYLGADDEEDDAAAAAETARKAEEARINKAAADARAAEAARNAPAATTGNEVMDKLNALSTDLNTRFSAIEKNFIPRSALAGYESSLLASAIKVSDDYAIVRETHRSEFGEPLDRDAFQKFVEDHTPKEMSADGKTVVKMGQSPYKNLQEAHDAFVGEKRTALKISKGIEEGVKTKVSAATVPGQTQSVAMSPAIAAIKKAQGEKKPGEGNAMAAARRLKELSEQRDTGNTVQ